MWKMKWWSHVHLFRLLKLLNKFISATIILASVCVWHAGSTQSMLKYLTIGMWRSMSWLKRSHLVEETFIREDERLFEDGREIVSWHLPHTDTLQLRDAVTSTRQCYSLSAMDEKGERGVPSNAGRGLPDIQGCEYKMSAAFQYLCKYVSDRCALREVLIFGQVAHVEVQSGANWGFYQAIIDEDIDRHCSNCDSCLTLMCSVDVLGNWQHANETSV